jgi:hypothetical protein
MFRCSFSIGMELSHVMFMTDELMTVMSKETYLYFIFATFFKRKEIGNCHYWL